METQLSKGLRTITLSFGLEIAPAFVSFPRSVLVVAAGSDDRGLLDIALGLGDFVLLGFQVGFNRQVWLRLTVVIGFGSCRRASGKRWSALILKGCRIPRLHRRRANRWEQ